MAFTTRPPFPSSAAPSAPSGPSNGPESPGFTTTTPSEGPPSTDFPATAACEGAPPEEFPAAPSTPHPVGGAPGPVRAGRRHTGCHSPGCAPPEHEAPRIQGVPPFEPLKVRGSALRLQRALRRQRRAMAAGLAVTAAALAASTAHGADDTAAESRAPGAPAPAAAAAPARKPQAGEQLVTAAVRIADAATVRLLRPGDRVDVIAAAEPVAGDEPRAEIVASCVRVTEVPGTGDASAEAGALVVLSVPRTTATALAGAGATSRLAVTVC